MGERNSTMEGKLLRRSDENLARQVSQVATYDMTTSRGSDSDGLLQQSANRVWSCTFELLHLSHPKLVEEPVSQVRKREQLVSRLSTELEKKRCSEANVQLLPVSSARRSVPRSKHLR
jgi:hypothetical protein